ncbi:MAG: tRNA-(ms[2]io[6]A)-hydroxylase [Gammaproteobacteria bacterium]|nr:tRNA-(ms[2]io[6]A)-hydroxylase [Gammaproteobacteria bacterium]
MKFELLTPTKSTWTEAVMADFDTFLLDHAACERKASSMAMSMLLHYPDQPNLVKEMTKLAIEELLHFKAVMAHIHERGLVLTGDEKDPYVNELRQAQRRGSQEYLMDRLITASIIEKRGAERFGLIAEALMDEKLKNFYTKITESEQRHYLLFLNLAKEYFNTEIIEPRLNELLIIEAKIVDNLPIKSALH